jgi:uncharacterized membrane protein YedE/YeeE
MPLVFGGGLLFGFGLGFSHMARPEVVLDFLQFDDLGLLFVLGGAAGVTGLAVAVANRLGGRAPLTGDTYTRRLRSLDRNVVAGGAIFGVGWGLSGACPGAAYASLGVGNLPILWVVAGMFAGAYFHGWIRSRTATDAGASAAAD